MKAFWHWFEERTGLGAAVAACCRLVIPAHTRWQRIWPAAILFAFAVEVITGIALWMFYSPSAQSAWESVYWIQYQVWGGWLARGLHYYAGQVLLALIGLYVIHMLVSGSYRAPREVVFWLAVLMALVTLAMLLTGDLLAWTQGGVKSTQVRTSYLLLLPWIGEGAYKLAVGGSGFGHLTVTRFFALHAGVFSLALCLLLYLHHRALRRVEATELASGVQGVPYWPAQALLVAAACLVVMAVMLLLVVYPAWTGDHPGERPGDYLGVELGPPADPAVPYDAARPDWYFVCLYQLASFFPSICFGPFNLELLPIFVIPGVLVLLVLAMPLVARWRKGHGLNLAITAVLVIGAVGLTVLSKYRDQRDPKYLAAVAGAQADALRVRQLARAPQGIPPTGALTLLRNDPKTQGPRLFAQHCASCHEWTDAQGKGITCEKPSAPNLYRFASREWIAGFFDPQQIDGPRYFGGTTTFRDPKTGKMVKFVKGLRRMHEDLGMSKEELAETVEKMITALAEQARCTKGPDAAGKTAQPAPAEKTVELFEALTCTECHRFHTKGTLGMGPDLTCYGSREWLIGIISDPANRRFYGSRNERMPAYAKTPERPEDNILTARQIEMLSEWLAGQWYEPGAQAGHSGE